MGDIAATTRYVSDTSALFRSAIAANKQETNSVNAVAEDISVHCRGALPGYLRTGTPAQQRIWSALANDETSGELFLALLRPVHKEYATALSQARVFALDPAGDQWCGGHCGASHSCGATPEDA